MSSNNPIIVSGSTQPAFTEKVCNYLGLKPGNTSHRTFSDGELWIKYAENIRGTDVFIIQSTQPPAENLMELLIMIDAAKRASANKITAVIPYFGYSRQDRKDQPRVAITSKLVANLITTAGADRVITMDLHTPQIQGFFDIPFDHLYSSPVFTNLFSGKADNLAVVSADVGGIKLARSYANKLNAELVVIDKRRPEANRAEVMNIIGDVEGRDVLLVDDLIDTGGTFVNAINAVKERGAKKVMGACTHPLLSGNAVEKLENSPLDTLYVTDSIPLTEKAIASSKIVVRSVTELIAEAIIRCYKNESISSLFEIDKG